MRLCYITVALHNPSAARRLVDDVERAIRERLDMAESFAPFPSTREREHPYYPIYVGNFIVLYVMVGHTMEVRRILYSRRDIEAVL